MTNTHASFTTTIEESTDIAEETKHFRFRISPESVIHFSPGQFFLLHVDEKTYRAYSIASSPESLPIFDLLVKRVPEGKATTLLWNSSVGDTLVFRGPMGRFGIQDPTRTQILIATGTGLAPMRSFWQSLLSQNMSKIHVIFGVRHASHLFCQEEFSELLAQYPDRFSVSLCLSRPESEMPGVHTGRVTDFVEKKMTDDDFTNAEVSLCGSKQMVQQMEGILEMKGMDMGFVNRESW